eukprot:TRINITY_DN13867_c2_g3_i1.p1 TRINITY_DN13867_c2_g3~~TRINITY_DN13867_c2_g3_i1.p1  ORF type:complete len:1402 (-),score=284.94 TRINITY_DN13867_c2_g3_i1:302-4507(-)
MKTQKAPLSARGRSTGGKTDRPPSGSISPNALAEDEALWTVRGREGTWPRGKAHSASPRPQRFRAVDAVKLAKSEIAKGTGPTVKAGRLRLTSLQPSFDSALSAGDSGPVLHEGFYNLAATVTRPEPSLRQKATALLRHLQSGLKSLRHDAAEKLRSEPVAIGAAKVATKTGVHETSAASQSTALAIADESSQPLALTDGHATADGTFITQEDQKPLAASSQLADHDLRLAPLASERRPYKQSKSSQDNHAEAELAVQEAELCIDVLEAYACETSADSRERSSLLDAAKGTAASAVAKLVSIIKRQEAESQQKDANLQELEARLQKTEEETADLRQMAQHLLSKEEELRSQNQEQQAQVKDKERKLVQAEKRLDDLANQLNEAFEAIAVQEKKQRRARENVRDGANSPMMAFSTFVLGPDQIPQGGAAPDKPESQVSIGGGALLTQKSEKPGGGTNSRRYSTRPSILMAQGQGLMIPGVGGPLARRNSKRLDSSSLLPQMSLRQTSDIPVKTQSSDADEQAGNSAQITVELPTTRSTPLLQSRQPKPSEEAESGSSDDEDSAGEPSASPLASCFPALVPYLDFRTADADADKTRAEDATRSHDHLEKHMKMLQEERQKHMERNQSMQRAVDSSLERMLVWVQAVVDSLRDFGPPSTRQDAQALAVIRDMLAWLAKRSCKDWIDPPEQLEQALTSHEERLRAALSSVAESLTTSKADELRKSLETQTKRVEELEQKLQEAEARAKEPLPAVAHGRGHAALLAEEHPPVSTESTPEGASAAAAAPTALVGGFASLADHDKPSTAGNRTTSGKRAHGGPATMDGASEDQMEAGSTTPATSPVGSAGCPDGLTCPDCGNVYMDDSLFCRKCGRKRDPVDEDTKEDAQGELAEPSEVESVQGLRAAEETEREAQKMRLFRCPFAEAIDLTLTSGTKLLATPENAADEGEEGAKYLGVRQLRSFISEIYAAKRTDDQRRDKSHQPRRLLHTVMQELLRRQHGVKRLVHQKSWQLLESTVQHASDAAVGLFADFLDGTRDLDELSFYLYSCSLLVSAVSEESHALPPIRLPMGIVSHQRSSRLIDMLFADLPKAHAAVKEDLEKYVPVQPAGWGTFSHDSFQDSLYSLEGDGFGGGSGVEVDVLCKALLAGWRVSSLLLDRSVANFSWRGTVLAFLKADTHYRGWLDQNQVIEAERHPAAQDIVPASFSSMDIPLADQTSLGAFVFRAVQHLGGVGSSTMAGNELPQATALMTPSTGARSRRQQLQEARLGIGVSAFSSLEKSLGVYMSWLQHSEEPRDLCVYQGVKSRIYAFRRASSNGEAWPSIHNLRCLLLLLLGHQFDMQMQREEVAPDHLGWEMTALLQVLRESWRRGASGSDGEEAGPCFGAELEEVGEDCGVGQSGHGEDP